MDEVVTAAEANRNFSRLLKGVREGRTYLVTSHGAPVAKLGLTGGDALTFTGLGTISVAQLKAAHEGWLPGYMAGKQ